MIPIEEFRKQAHQLVDWMADYLQNIEQYPVKSQVKPGDIFQQLPENPPQASESIDQIMEDFKSIILPGMTHWQSPNFFAYFPANSSYPSVLAEMLTATLGAQCMIWETSPAAAELEEKMMEWFKHMLDLPKDWHGVIQDTASTATLCAFLTAREKVSGYAINEQGFRGNEKFRIYGSSETHSSIDKAVKIAGFGQQNLVKVGVDEQMRLDTRQLRQAIENDLKAGFKPLCVVATLGTTGTTAIDPLKAMAEICRQYNVWLHVDAAFAGSALILPEYRWMLEGAEQVDSFVFNPHKWMFTNFDCSAYFVKDKEALIRTFSILPEYLKTKTHGQVNDYRDWGVPLGRRFRALKLWFVIRNFGVKGIQERLRRHIDLAAGLEQTIKEHPHFELLTPRTLNLLCFRYRPAGVEDDEALNRINETLLQEVNATGKLFITHTKIQGKYTLRMVIGQTYVTAEHVRRAWEVICRTAERVLR